jgi:hypothetical protein
MIRNAIAATCEYVEDNRRTTAINFVLDAFNGKADSILSRVCGASYPIAAPTVTLALSEYGDIRVRGFADLGVLLLSPSHPGSLGIRFRSPGCPLTGVTSTRTPLIRPIGPKCSSCAGAWAAQAVALGRIAER